MPGLGRRPVSPRREDQEVLIGEKGGLGHRAVAGLPHLVLHDRGGDARLAARAGGRVGQEVDEDYPPVGAE